MTTSQPNILITGTPGCGKTHLAKQIVSSLKALKYVNISDIVKEKQFYQEFDKERDCFVIDEDKVGDYLEQEMDIEGAGGLVVETHSLVDYFPERWFDLVICLQTNNSILFDRLKQRKYSDTKIQENIQCEIMQVIAQEAKESYPQEIVQLLPSNTEQDSSTNLLRIKGWYKSFTERKQ